MGKVWRTALAAAGAAALAGAGPRGSAPDVTGEVCELSHADRATTRAASCMGCHDGTAGAGVGFRMRAGNTPGFDHPVDVDYRSAAAGNPRLRAQPGPEVVLVDGRISCTTCHDGASREQFHVAGNPRNLCLSCHDL